MADVLTAAERRAIVRFFTEGGTVNRIPGGVSGKVVELRGSRFDRVTSQPRAEKRNQAERPFEQVLSVDAFLRRGAA